MSQHNVTVYSTPTCHYCVLAKKYLTEKGVQFQDVDVSTDRSKVIEMVEKSNQMGVPVIDINGNIIVGFRPDAFDELLNK